MSNEPRKPPCALVVMGVSGSGKTTIADKLAERLGWTCEDGDKYHPKSNVDKMSAGHPLTDEDRWPWLNAIADEIERVCKARGHVVVADQVVAGEPHDPAVGMVFEDGMLGVQIQAQPVDALRGLPFVVRGEAARPAPPRRGPTPTARCPRSSSHRRLPAPG